MRSGWREWMEFSICWNFSCWLICSRWFSRGCPNFVPCITGLLYFSTPASKVLPPYCGKLSRLRIDTLQFAFQIAVNNGTKTLQFCGPRKIFPGTKTLPFFVFVLPHRHFLFLLQPKKSKNTKNPDRSCLSPDLDTVNVRWSVAPSNPVATIVLILLANFFSLLKPRSGSHPCRPYKPRSTILQRRWTVHVIPYKQPQK